MRFALLGTHPDGVAMACALVESGRHELVAYTSAEPVPEPIRRRWGKDVRRLHDLEELLADPSVEAVVVAGSPANRPAQLRRALQSERHVLCVHPPDDTPDIAYEAAMLQGDTGRVPLPLLPEALHPAVRRLAEMTNSSGRPLGSLQLLEVERWSTAVVFWCGGDSGQKACFPGWDVLRVLGGEIAEVSALARGQEPEPEEPLLICGRFERSGVFQVSLLPYQPAPRLRIGAIGSHGRAELLFPDGPGGPAFLSWRGPDGEWHEESWDAWDPWPALVEVFERATAQPAVPVLQRQAAGAASAPLGVKPNWQDAIRCLELDDAVRRSVQRRRSSVMEYQEVSEEVGFKGTMTLLGCGLLWVMILLLILAFWFPKAGWVVLPLLVVFLALQVLRWVVPRSKQAGQGGDGQSPV